MWQVKHLQEQVVTLQEQVATQQERIKTLESQLGGSNWLAARSAFETRSAELKSAQKQLHELNDLLAVGSQLRAKGDKLLAALGTEASSRKAGLQAALQAPLPSKAADVNLTERRIDQLAEHLEQQLFHAGAGGVGRTQLLANALMRRPAVQRILSQRDGHTEKLNQAMRAMVDSAKGVLEHLTAGRRGSRTIADHECFETIVAALTPDDAPALNLISAIGELLGIDHKQIERALVHCASSNLLID